MCDKNNSSFQEVIEEINIAWEETFNDLNNIGEISEELNKLKYSIKYNAIFDIVLNDYKAAYHFDSLIKLTKKADPNFGKFEIKIKNEDGRELDRAPVSELDSTRANISNRMKTDLPRDMYEYDFTSFFTGADEDDFKEIKQIIKHKDVFAQYNIFFERRQKKVQNKNNTSDKEIAGEYYCRTCSPLFAFLLFKYWRDIRNMVHSFENGKKIVNKFNNFIEDNDCQLEGIDRLIFYYCIERYFRIMYNINRSAVFNKYEHIVVNEYEKNKVDFIKNFIDTYKDQFDLGCSIEKEQPITGNGQQRFIKDLVEKEFEKKYGNIEKYINSKISFFINYFSNEIKHDQTSTYLATNIPKSFIFGQRQLFALIYKNFTNNNDLHIDTNNSKFIISEDSCKIDQLMQNYKEKTKIIFDKMINEIGFINDTDLVDKYREIFFKILASYMDDILDTEGIWIKTLEKNNSDLSNDIKKSNMKIEQFLSRLIK